MNDIIPFLESKMLPCTTKSWLGFDCPGCGIQRAFIALLKGDLLVSLQLYPALIPLLLFFSLLTSLAQLASRPRSRVVWLVIERPTRPYNNIAVDFRLESKITRAATRGYLELRVAKGQRVARTT